MRRGDLWAQAKARAVEAIEACRPGRSAGRVRVRRRLAPRPRLRRIGDARPVAASGHGEGARGAAHPELGGHAPGPGPHRRRGAIEDVADVGAEVVERPAPDRPDQRPPAGQPARRARRLRMALGRGARSEDGRHGRLQRRARSGSPGRTRASRPPTGRERPPRAGLERRDFEDGVVRPGLDRRQGRRRSPPMSPRARAASSALPRPAGGRTEAVPAAPGAIRRSSTTSSTSRPRRGSRPPSSTSGARPPTIRRACFITSTASSRIRHAAVVKLESRSPAAPPGPRARTGRSR